MVGGVLASATISCGRSVLSRLPNESQPPFSARSLSPWFATLPLTQERTRLVASHVFQPVVVTAADAVPWTKPDELDFDPEKDMIKLLGFFPSNVCNVALGDGSVRALSKSITAKTLGALITRSGGEVVGDDF